jgi:hypothetical protein
MTCPWPSNVVPTRSPIGYCRMLDKIQPFQHETVCHSLLKQSGVWRGCAGGKVVPFLYRRPGKLAFLALFAS